MANLSEEVQLALLIERVEILQDKVKGLEDEVTSFKTTANRWKGGFLALVSLGSIVGWLLTTWEKLIKVFH